MCDSCRTVVRPCVNRVSDMLRAIPSIVSDARARMLTRTLGRANYLWEIVWVIAGGGAWLYLIRVMFGGD